MVQLYLWQVSSPPRRIKGGEKASSLFLSTGVDNMWSVGSGELKGVPRDNKEQPKAAHAPVTTSIYRSSETINTLDGGRSSQLVLPDTSEGFSYTPSKLGNAGDQRTHHRWRAKELGLMGNEPSKELVNKFLDDCNRQRQGSGPGSVGGAQSEMVGRKHDFHPKYAPNNLTINSHNNGGIYNKTSMSVSPFKSAVPSVASPVPGGGYHNQGIYNMNMNMNMNMANSSSSYGPASNASGAITSPYKYASPMKGYGGNQYDMGPRPVTGGGNEAQSYSYTPR